MIWKIIMAWIAFDAAVFIWMWFDHAYYRFDLPTKYKRIMEAFTEEVDDDTNQY